MEGNPPVVDPHLVDEDPEENLGEVIQDPWEDSTQLDWPLNTDVVDEPAEDPPADPDAFVDDRDNVEVID